MPVCSSKGLLEGLVGNVCVFEEFSFSTCSVLPVASLCFGNMGGGTLSVFVGVTFAVYQWSRLNRLTEVSK